MDDAGSDRPNPGVSYPHQAQDPKSASQSQQNHPITSFEMTSSQPMSANTDVSGHVSNTNASLGGSQQQQRMVLYSRNKYYSLISAMIHAAKEKSPQHKEALDAMHDAFRQKCQNLALSLPGIGEAFKFAVSGLQRVLGNEIAVPIIVRYKNILQPLLHASKDAGNKDVENSQQSSQPIQQQQQQQQQQQPLQPNQRQQQAAGGQAILANPGIFQPPIQQPSIQQPSGQHPGAGTKRPASEMDNAINGSAPKAKRPAKSKSKSKKQVGENGDKDGDEDMDEAVMVVGGEVIPLTEETDIMMERVVKSRDTSLAGLQQPRATQYLSAWRLGNEILKQKKEKSFQAPMESLFDASVLDAIQLGFAQVAADVIERANSAARHRTMSVRPVRSSFVENGVILPPTWDVRRELGRIRKREEETAEAKAAEEREKVLRAAASKRADEETKALAQRAKAEMAGQMQAAAANKALAATLAGGDAKWARWGGGGGETEKEKEKEKQQEKEKEKEKAGGQKTKRQQKQDCHVMSAPSGVQLEERGHLTGQSQQQSSVVQIEDIVAALKQHPRLCSSVLLYRLLNQ